MYHGNERMMDTMKDIKPKSIKIWLEWIMYYAMVYSMSGRQKVLGFYSYLYTVTLAHMRLINNMSSFVKNVIMVKHNTSAIGETCPSVVYCFLKYLREWQFFKEIVIFQRSDPFLSYFKQIELC